MHDDDEHIPHMVPVDPIVRITRWDIVLAVVVLLACTLLACTLVYCSLQ